MQHKLTLVLISVIAFVACDNRQTEINSCLKLENAAEADRFFADPPKQIQMCKIDNDCVAEISSCGKVFPAHKDFQSCVAHALSMRESVIDCRRGEVVEYQPVCRAGQCDVEDVAHIASRAYVLTTNFMTDNEFLFYSDLWSVSVPMDIGVEYENGIPEYQNPLPTIVFGFDRSVKVNPPAPGALGDFAGKKWAVDREGRLRIGDRVYRYSAEYRALFNPLPDPSDNLGNFIIRKDLASYFRRNPF